MKTPALTLAPLLLGGCAAFAPPVEMPPATPPVPDAPKAWQAPPPPADARASLQDWWQQFDDPVLLQMIDAAQAASPTVATAASRIEQARASSVAAGALLLPMSQIGRRLAEIPVAPDKPVLLICNTQNRSSRTLKALRERGYGHVRFVNGGMSEWAKRGWPMVAPPR